MTTWGCAGAHTTKHKPTNQKMTAKHTQRNKEKYREFDHES